MNEISFTSGPYGIACAPEELAGRRFFDAMTGPTWYVNATAYGHADLMDPVYVELNEVIDLFSILGYYWQLKLPFLKFNSCINVLF